jgi:hypothetical protein
LAFIYLHYTSMEKLNKFKNETILSEDIPLINDLSIEELFELKENKINLVCRNKKDNRKHYTTFANLHFLKERKMKIDFEVIGVGQVELQNQNVIFEVVKQDLPKIEPKTPIEDEPASEPQVEPQVEPQTDEPASEPQETLQFPKLKTKGRPKK